MRPLLIALALLGTVSCASRRPHAESDPTEWLPTIKTVICSGNGISV
jgi:hypothetical protein